MTIVVESLHIYPVKACRGVGLDRMAIGETGPVGDRRWQVVDAGAKPVTQRVAPVLATVEVTVIEGGLRLAAPGREAIEVADPGSGPVAEPISVHPLVGPPVEAGDGGDEVAAWLGDLVGQPVRLAAMTAATDIRLPAAIDLWGHRISFVDAAPVLVTNRASLEWLAERASEPFGMERFRPNIVVSGAEPWVEDTWTDFTIGAARFTAGLPWPRCAVPQVDQATGERRKEPASILKAHRWCEVAPGLPEALRPIVEGSALFGMACDVRREVAGGDVAPPVGAELAVGDEVTILATGDPVLAPPT
jgi:uncharacterized protein YcbX